MFIKVGLDFGILTSQSYTTTTVNATLTATQKVFSVATITETAYQVVDVAKAKRAPAPTPTLPAYLNSLIAQDSSEDRPVPALVRKNAAQDAALVSSVSSACTCLGITVGITLYTPVAEPTVC